jgi:hypothetical protein
MQNLFAFIYNFVLLFPLSIITVCDFQIGVDDGPKFAEFYFKCAEHTSQGEEDQAVPLYLIKSNVRNIPCLACTDIRYSFMIKLRSSRKYASWLQKSSRLVWVPREL